MKIIADMLTINVGIKKAIFFEPVKDNFKMLKSKIPDSDDVMLFNIALEMKQERRRCSLRS